MKRLILLLLCLCFATAYGQSKETKINVRAKAKDAKFIGSSLGGARVIIRDKNNGRILAEGKTEGSTGNTRLIMETPKGRYQPISDETTAGFQATIDIQEPTFVRVEVYAPANHKQAQIAASTELWLLPGKHILGDGIVLEIPGFIIDILKPRTHQYIALDSIREQPVMIHANIVMMCGCVINKGGLWNSDEIEVKGLLKKDGSPFQEVEMELTDVNLFSGVMKISDPGNYELTVYAFNEKSGNTGIDQVNFVIH